jgi:hypothetical protein
MSVFGDYIYVVLTSRPEPTGTFIARVHRCGGAPVVIARRGKDNQINAAPILLDGDLYFSGYNNVMRTRP